MMLKTDKLLFMTLKKNTDNDCDFHGQSIIRIMK